MKQSQFISEDRLLKKAISILMEKLGPNDGPDLLLGSMWSDYAYIENSCPGLIKVVTLRMIPERITMKWLLSKKR